jgi:enoyl-CoA hydratase
VINTAWHERVALLSIARPERRNALDTEHCRLLLEAVDAASGAGARVVVITGEGTAFCAGHDLRERTARASSCHCTPCSTVCARCRSR